MRVRLGRHKLTPMHWLIELLLHRFTEFQVLASSMGHIAGIGVSRFKENGTLKEWPR